MCPSAGCHAERCRHVRFGHVWRCESANKPPRGSLVLLLLAAAAAAGLTACRPCQPAPSHQRRQCRQWYLVYRKATRRVLQGHGGLCVSSGAQPMTQACLHKPARLSSAAPAWGSAAPPARCVSALQPCLLASLAHSALQPNLHTPPVYIIRSLQHSLSIRSVTAS